MKATNNSEQMNEVTNEILKFRTELANRTRDINTALCDLKKSLDELFKFSTTRF